MITRFSVIFILFFSTTQFGPGLPSINLFITYSSSGDVGFLEHVVVQISTSFVDVDADDYLINNKVYNDLYNDYIYNRDNYSDLYMPNRGDIQFELISPQGTKSTLLPYREKDSWPGDFDKWSFMSVHFWGEDH